MMDESDTRTVRYEYPRMVIRRIFLVVLVGLVIGGIDFLTIRHFNLEVMPAVFLGVALVSLYTILCIIILRHVFSPLARLPQIEVIERSPEEGMQWEPAPEEPLVPEVKIQEIEGTVVKQPLLSQKKVQKKAKDKPKSKPKSKPKKAGKKRAR